MDIPFKSMNARGRNCRLFRRFIADEEGSFSIEAVIWMPVFAMILAIIMNVSLVFFNESQMLRIVQDANRAFSLGRLEDAYETETYIAEQLAYLDADLTIITTLSSGVISTTLSVPATDLMPMNFMKGTFDNVQITVAAQHIVEF